MKKMYTRFAVLVVVSVVALTCTKKLSPDAEVCSGFSDWLQSAYVLPYPVGLSYVIDQANCSPHGNGHRGNGRYAYDFLMPIGTLITVARGGEVIHVEQSHANGEIAEEGKDNYIAISHADGTVDIYGHITKNGSFVHVGQVVNAGDTLAKSGNTGNTNNIPHLHLSQHQCDPVTKGSSACITIPVTFRNTVANPEGLKQGQRYLSLRY